MPLPPLCSILLILSIAACSGPQGEATAPAPLRGVLRVHVREGSSASREPMAATLAFVRVTADSRCPMGAQCIHPGEASVLLSYVPDQGAGATFELMTGPEGSRLDTLGLSFALEALTPHPVAEPPEPSIPSIATIRVSSAEK